MHEIHRVSYHFLNSATSLLDSVVGHGSFYDAVGKNKLLFLVEISWRHQYIPYYFKATDPCATNNGGCTNKCTNNNGVAVCEATNPCMVENGGCAQSCAANNGVATCSCEEGYLQPDQKSCSSKFTWSPRWENPCFGARYNKALFSAQFVISFFWVMV